MDKVKVVFFKHIFQNKIKELEFSHCSYFQNAENKKSYMSKAYTGPELRSYEKEDKSEIRIIKNILVFVLFYS